MSQKTTSLHFRPTGRRPWSSAGNGVSAKSPSEATLFFSRAAQTLDVLLAVHDALLETSRAGIHVTLAEGNHDLVNQESVRGYCHVFDCHPDVTVVDDFLTLSRPGWEFALHLMSYFAEDRIVYRKARTVGRESAFRGKETFSLYTRRYKRGIGATIGERIARQDFSPV